MAAGIGNLGQIVEDFKESLGQIFGGAGSTNVPKTGRVKDYFHPEYGGSNTFNSKNWVGNTRNVTDKAQKLRYGFMLVSADTISGNKGLLFSESDPNLYYLDIAPQQIMQKETFATNISATRRGIIVESEGNIFKDITIKGMTGVFPGERGSFNGPQANLSDITAPPAEPVGVSDQGLSKKSNVKIVSGYQEFLMLRQFFLKYAHDKVKANGDLFMIFLNEKDNQALIVEPLDFTMDRNSKRPMEYAYTISLKGIGSFNTLFSRDSGTTDTDIFQKIGNISANLSAGIGQVRAAINVTSSSFQKTFQAIDQTVNGPLRQVQFALQDLSDGITTVISLPTILARNFTSTIAGIRENAANIGTSLGFNNSADSKAAAAQSTQQAQVLDHINNDSRVAMPREFVASTRDKLRSLTDDLADAFNLSDPLYNNILGRTPTNIPSPLKVVSDEEFLLLGNMQTMADSLNQVLSTNDAFQTSVEGTYQDVKNAFGPSLIDITPPATVRQVRIQRNDTLERLAQRELGDAIRWTEIVILNKLKTPYIDDNGGDGVKKPGDTVLVPGE